MAIFTAQNMCETNFEFSSNVKFHNTGLQLKPRKIAKHEKQEIENGQDQNEEEIRFDNRVQAKEGHHQVTLHRPIEVKTNHHINRLRDASDTVLQNQK